MSHQKKAHKAQDKRKLHRSGEPLVIGVTGGIACGKSKVVKYISQQLLCPHLDADALCRALLQPHQPGWSMLLAEESVPLHSDQKTIDRPALRAKIFHDQAFRDAINKMVHPLALKAMQREIAAACVHHNCIIVEVPLLFEAGWQDQFHVVIAVVCGHEKAVCRLVQRDKVTREEAEAAMTAQLPQQLKEEYADFCFHNSGSWAATCEEINQFTEKIKKILTSNP